MNVYRERGQHSLPASSLRGLRIVEQQTLVLESTVFANDDGERFDVRRVRHGRPNVETVA
jgi:hypothetical protein